MIRNDTEYKEAVKRLKAERARLAKHEQSLGAEGLTPAEIKRAMDPLRSFHLQLDEEVGQYERLKRGDFDGLVNLRGLGRLLIGLRIAQGLSQKELADRLQVHESQVSRDERNEYHGATVDRAEKILEALQVVVVTNYDPTHSVASWSGSREGAAPAAAKVAKGRKSRRGGKTKTPR